MHGLSCSPTLCLFSCFIFTSVAWDTYYLLFVAALLYQCTVLTQTSPERNITSKWRVLLTLWYAPLEIYVVQILCFVEKQTWSSNRWCPGTVTVAIVNHKNATGRVWYSACSRVKFAPMASWIPDFDQWASSLHHESRAGITASGGWRLMTILLYLLPEDFVVLLLKLITYHSIRWF